MMSEAALVQIAARLAVIEQSLADFQDLAWVLLMLANRSPVRLDVERLDVDHLEFKLDSVDVGELSGELNIGLTNRFNLNKAPPPGVETASGQPAETDAVEAESAESPPTQQLWPPPQV